MSVIRSQYVRELEEKMAGGKSFEKAHEKAVKKTTVRSIRKRPENDEGIVKSITRKLREVFYGSKTYAKKKFKPSRRRRK